MFRLSHPKTWDPAHLHDWFNLIVIGVLNVLNLTYIATGHGFGLFWTASQAYIILDLVFVGVYPQSVKSPVAILVHHLITALYMLIPYHYPQYHWCMAACMLVEVNTWLLIARRVVGGRLIEAGFYATWVGLRNLYYPYLIWAFAKEWRVEAAACGTGWNWILVTPLFQACLSGLNYMWTWQLVSKMVWPKGRKGAGGGGGGGGGVCAVKGGGVKGGAARSALSEMADVRADVRAAHGGGGGAKAA